MVVELNEETFVENVFDFKKGAPYAFKGQKPIIIEYFAHWCQHCKAMKPILNEVSEELKNEISFFKVNLEHFPGLGKPFHILSFPTYILLIPNKRPEVVVGEMQAINFRKLVAKMLED